MPVTTNHGVSIVPGKGTTRIHMGCTHQRGLVYVVPAEKSWVCTENMLPGHALAGFLGELTAQRDSRVEEMMQRWGIYYRQMPLEEPEG